MNKKVSSGENSLRNDSLVGKKCSSPMCRGEAVVKKTLIDRRGRPHAILKCASCRDKVRKTGANFNAH
jgi:hypothetical protein